MARVSSDSRVVTPSDPALYTPAMVTIGHHQVTATGQMLELNTQMSNNKDPKHETNKVKHTKFTLDCNAQPLFSYDYSESFLTFKKPVGKTHNCSNLFKGVKTKKKNTKKS